MAPVRVGVIEIGATAIDLLVADVEEGSLLPVLERRAFVAPRRGDEPALASLAGAQAASARSAGAEALLTAGSGSLRRYAELRRLDRSCRREGAGPLRVLSPGQEARLAFRGATRVLAGEARVAVVGAAAAATSIAVGWPGTEPEWWGSRPVGSRLLGETAGTGPAPTAGQQAALAAAARRRLASLAPPECEVAYVAGEPSAMLALRGGPSPATGVPAEAARHLPAALGVLREVAELLGCPLEPAGGGLREGLALRAATLPAGAGGR